jgi:hypothetical protein
MNCRFGVYRRSRRRPTPPAGRSRPRCLTFGFLFAGLAAALLATAAEAAQDQLAINTATDGPVLRFDWSAVQIGIGSYEEGPTGLTIFRFSATRDGRCGRARRRAGDGQYRHTASRLR